MERTLAIILFVLLLVGLGHMYHNSSLKEGARGVLSTPQCGHALDGNYREIKSKILRHIKNKETNGDISPQEARAMKKAEHMIHTYSRAIDLYYQNNGDKHNTISAGRNLDPPLFNQGPMGSNEFKFIKKLAKSLEARKNL